MAYEEGLDVVPAPDFTRRNKAVIRHTKQEHEDALLSAIWTGMKRPKRASIRH
jgi:hypothetical protein